MKKHWTWYITPALAVTVALFWAVFAVVRLCLGDGIGAGIALCLSYLAEQRADKIIDEKKREVR